MFSIFVFALLSMASAQYLNQYPSYKSYGAGYGSYGVNPVVPQYAVPHVGQNYGFAHQKVVPHTYASALTAPTVEYDRDFNIEHMGEKYAYQSGPAQFQYSFIRGNDYQPKAFAAAKFVEPSVSSYAVPHHTFPATHHTYATPHHTSYAVPHHARVSAETPAYGYGNQWSNFYGAQPFVQPYHGYSAKVKAVAPKVDMYSAKDIVV